MTSDIFNFKYRFKKPQKKTLKKVKFKEVAIPRMPHTIGMSRVTKMANNRNALPINRRSEAKILRMTGTLNRPGNGLYNVINKSKDIGFRRINQQKGLKPTGDFDKDGLINMLDCNPRNFFEQGPSHTVDTKLEDGTYVPEGTTAYREPAQSTAPTDADILRARQEQEAVLKAKAMEKAQKLRESRYIRESVLKEKVKDKAQKLRESQYIRDQVNLQRAKDNAYQLTRAEKRLRAADTFVTGASTGISSFSKSVTGGVTGVGGFGINQAKLAPPQQGMSKANKLRVFLGKEPIPEQNYVTVAQPVQSQVPQQGGVESPYSKRKVSYVRGPYKK